MRFRDLKKHQNKIKHQQEKAQYAYATYIERVKALITDMFMIYAPILYLITYVIMSGKDEFQSSQLAPLMAITLYGLVYAVLVSKFGQTPGKKAYTIEIIDESTGKHVSFLKAFCRFIAFLFSATILLGVLLPFYRKDKKALHDLVCKTVVVKTEV